MSTEITKNLIELNKQLAEVKCNSLNLQWKIEQHRAFLHLDIVLNPIVYDLPCRPTNDIIRSTIVENAQYKKDVTELNKLKCKEFNLEIAIENTKLIREDENKNKEN